MRQSTKKNLQTIGFDKEIQNVENNQCPFCGSKKTSQQDFRDDISWEEFNISGLCQSCQDGVFGVGDEQ